ncbi:MAG: hypothetical protein EOO63_14175 [Hymenobacter sp.]|nr:MAG: hypothetical protein EOO63_14175 [Hymenobacter sp.]
MADLTYYERNLPHWLPPGSTLFLTFRLAGTLPSEVLARYHAEWALEDQAVQREETTYARQRRYFGRFDTLLAGAPGPTWLWHETVAGIVKESLHYYDEKAYQLNCYCIMPNHVHVLLTLPDEAPTLSRTLQSIKSYTAARANKLLERNGAFWHRETYDHICRDAAEVQRINSYILLNPVKAGLVTEWQHWPHTYLP